MTPGDHGAVGLLIAATTLPGADERKERKKRC
jgi:hypothetical protein